MKKRDLKSLKLNKKFISNLRQSKGGAETFPSFTCPESWLKKCPAPNPDPEPEPEPSPISQYLCSEIYCPPGL